MSTSVGKIIIYRFITLISELLKYTLIEAILHITDVTKEDKITDALTLTRQLPRRPLVHLTHMYVCYQCLRLSHFPKPWKEAIVITLLKLDKGHKFYQRFTAKLFEKVILKIEFSLMFTSTVRNSIHFHFLYLLFLHYMFRPM
jgi:hypothetical protein